MICSDVEGRLLGLLMGLVNDGMLGIVGTSLGDCGFTPNWYCSLAALQYVSLP